MHNSAPTPYQTAGSIAASPSENIPHSMQSKNALVVFSGGQDSATCLAWALERYQQVYTLGFDYGQRHHVEMDCRTVLLQNIPAMKPHWGQRFRHDHIINTDFFQYLQGNALLSSQDITSTAGGSPNTFVPGRNLVFATLAAAYAYSLQVTDIIMGVCETDSSGYPDCRDDAMKAMQIALNIGMQSHFTLQTPLMWLNKAETWLLAQSLGGTALVDCILEHSHTCYLGKRTLRHAWGYGCGTCPACVLRARGYAAFSQSR